MNAIVNTAPGKVEWCEQELPQPGLTQVRIRTATCGICATDLEMIAGWQRTGFPAIPGHEWSGIIDAVGAGVDHKLIGQPCVGDNVWPDGGEVGFEHPGGYAQYFLTQAGNIYPLPATFCLTTATLIEPLAVCVRGLRRLRLEDPACALILGDGPIGILLLLLLKARAIKRIVVVGGRPRRLELARALGANDTINYHDTGGHLADALKALGCSFSNILEASGSPAAIDTALQVAPPCAKLLLIGDYATARANLPWNQILLQQLEIIGTNASAGAWPEAVRLATSGDLPLHKLISAVLPAASYADALNLARQSRDAVKIVLNWNSQPNCPR